MNLPAPKGVQPLSTRVIVRTLLASAATAVAAALSVAALPPALAQSVHLASPATLLSPAAATVHQREGFEPMASHTSASPSGQFNSGIMFVADQLDRILQVDLRRRPTVVTSIVSLDDLAQTSPLGRLVAEHLMHELQLRSWAVTDIRMTGSVAVSESGEFSMSRSGRDRREAGPAANLVTGTYTSTDDGVLLSVRIVDAASGHVLSSAQTRLMRDRFVATLVDKPPRPAPAPVLGTVQLGAQCPSVHGCPAPR